MKTNYSTLKQIIEFSNNLSIDYKEVINNIISDETDFEVDNYRFIHQDYIDEIQCNELKSDTYILGCFNADFLADIIDWDYEVISVLQNADKYELIGQHIFDKDYISEIQSEYSRLDGYGHHFALYDSETIEDILSISGYYVFRVN